MNPRAPIVSAAAAVVIAFFMVFVVPAGYASASPTPSLGTNQAPWAYGAVKNVTFSGTTVDGWTYVLTASYGYSVILNQSNSTGGVFQVSVDRVMGVNFSFVACKPDCANPAAKGIVSVHALESTTAFANFTTLGSVLEGSTSVPAIALVNSSSFSRANLTDSVSMESSSGLVNWSTYLAASTQSHAAVSFPTPLGLIPLNLSAPQSWTAQSAFVALGSAGWDYYYGWSTLRNGVGHRGPFTGDVSVTGAGIVNVAGSYSGITIPFGGVNYPVLALNVVGPFSVREGFILLPTGGDLFSSASQPWASNESGAATVQIGAVDARPIANGHFGLVASSWVYQSSSTDQSGVAPAALVASDSASPDLGATQAPATTVQGSPLSPAEAQKVAGCLQTGIGCPATSNPSPSHLFGGLLGVGLVAAALVVIVAVVLVAERRRVPPPVYPNATLYPPGATGTPVRPAGSRATDAPPPPNEDDPLSHLW